MANHDSVESITCRPDAVDVSGSACNALGSIALPSEDVDYRSTCFDAASAALGMGNAFQTEGGVGGMPKTLGVPTGSSKAAVSKREKCPDAQKKNLFVTRMALKSRYSKTNSPHPSFNSQRGDFGNSYPGLFPCKMVSSFLSNSLGSRFVLSNPATASCTNRATISSPEGLSPRQSLRTEYSTQC